MRAFLLLGALAGCDCGDPPAPDGADDAGADAGPEHEPTRITCGDATLVVSWRPLRIALEDAAGSVLGETDAASFSFATILAPRPEEFFDPRGDDDVTWSDAGEVRSVTEGDTTSFEIDSDVADAMHLDVSCPDDGHLRLVLRLDGPDDVVNTRVRFATSPDDRFHGLGERFGGADATGEVRAMELHVGGGIESGYNEVHVPVPFVVSPKGWGAFVESRRAGAFDFGSTDPDTWSATFDEVGLVLHLFQGAPLDVVRAFTRLSGLPRLPPAWSHGGFYWRNENVSSDEVRADAEEFRTRDIPLSVLWIDNPWQTAYNDFTFDEGRFADPQGLVDDLHARGYRTMLWSTPYLDAVSSGDPPANDAEALYVEAEDAGFLVLASDGGPFRFPWGGGAASGMPDFTNDDAVAWFQDLVGRVTTMGFDGFKLDYGEEIVVELVGIRPQLAFSNGESEATMHGVYSRLYHRTYQGALARDRGEGFVLGRASAWGGQTDADCIWPGDIDADFSRHEGGNVGGLPAAVSALQSLSESGFPCFGSDTGGYREGQPTKEVLLRWAGHTSFTPMMQLGGSGGPGDTHAPWVFDEETVDAYRVFARWHVDLAPTMEALAARASDDGTPIVRSMALAFPDDPDAWDEIDQYLLGPDLLVAPLVEGGTSRSVYLPAGRWLDLFADEIVEGGASMPRDTPLDEVPVYLREGGVLVLGAPDIDTLVASDDLDVVDAGDRASLRRVIAFGDGESATTEPHVTISPVVRGGAGHEVSCTTPGAVTETLFELHALGRTVEDAAFAEAAAAGDVIAGCDCFFYDAGRDVLLVGAAGETTFVAQTP